MIITLKPIWKNIDSGFSIVELIVVIVIVGIIGISVFARFVNRSAINVAAAQDSIITVSHAAQQASLGRSNVSFEIDESGGSWIFSAIANGTTLRSVSISSDNVILETGSTVTSANTCSNSFDIPVANDFAIGYDRNGDIVYFTNNSSTEQAGALFNGVRICVNDNVSQSVCVSPAGYAFEGNCLE